MNRYQVLYKCSMCGTYIAYGNSAQMNEENAVDIIAKVLKDQQFIGSSFLRSPLLIPHKCGNGNYGAAYFAGLRKVEDDEREKCR